MCDNVTGEEYGQTNLVLVPDQMKIFLKTLQTGRRIIVTAMCKSTDQCRGERICLPIDVVHEVDEDDQRHDQKINLATQLLLMHKLFGRKRVCIIMNVWWMGLFFMELGGIRKLF